MNSTSYLDIENSITTISESWFIPLDIVMIICSILVITIAIIFLLIIILDKTCHTILMMLIGNTCLSTLISGCCLLSLCIFTIENDIKQIVYQDLFCVFRGYLTAVSNASNFYSFLLQATYRYIYVFHSNRLSWRSFQFQISFIFLTWIVAFVYPIPYIIPSEIIYDINNQICLLPLYFSLSRVYMAFAIYVIPVLMIAFIYFKLVRYIKDISKRVTLGNALSRAKNELKMVRHIVILVSILITFSFPYVIFVLLSFFKTSLKYYFRMTFVFNDVSILAIVILLQSTEPFKTALLKRIKRQPNNRVAAVA